MNGKTEIITNKYNLMNLTNSNLELENYYTGIFEKRRSDIISMFSNLPHIQEIKEELNKE